MATYTIIGGDQKEYGPISEAQLRRWIVDGRANAQSRVKAEGATGWKTLSDFPEFGSGSTSSASSPPLTSPATSIASKTSGLAVTSLVLGIFGIVTCGFTALFGLIFGIIAMVKVKNSGGRLSGHGLALAGIIISGIFLVIFFFGILAGMLLPALGAKQKAEAINCVNNERQLALAVKIYSADHTNHFPPAPTWCDAITNEVGSQKTFQCRATTSGSRCDYAFNAKLAGLDENEINPSTVMFFESDAGWNASGGPELMIAKPRHARVFVVGLADGSVQQLRESQLNTLRWDP